MLYARKTHGVNLQHCMCVSQGIGFVVSDLNLAELNLMTLIGLVQCLKLAKMLINAKRKVIVASSD